MKLSIVVPFYNVERYIAACLESLQNQTMGDFEAILVDDGSQDGSYDVAKAFCESDERFRIVRQENAGLGPARNTGIAHAQGEYLTFVDSDDLVPARAYDQMVRSLDASVSDMVSGDARRFNDLGVRDSYVHREPFATERIGTHVREFPPLALDRMAWNKVIRRSYWDEHGFEFPPIMYEDYPVTIKLHVLARKVDVLSSPVYYWREREGGELSITQRKWELKNIRDRADSAAAVLDFLHAEAPELAPVVEQHLLHIDVSAIAAALHENDPSEHADILELADRIYRRTSSASREAVIPFERIQNDLLARQKLSELGALMDHRAQHGTSAPLRRTGRLRPAYHLELPFLDDIAVGVPTDLYRVPADEAGLAVRVRDAAWRDGLLHLDLFTAIRGFAMTDDSTVEVWAEGPGGRRARKVRLPVERYAAARPLFDRDLSGARVVVDPVALGGGELPGPGFWRLMVRVRTAGEKQTRQINNVDPGRARWAPGTMLADGTFARCDHTSNGYGIQFRRPWFAVSAVEVHGSELVIRGRFRAESFDPAPRLRLWVDDGSAERMVDTTATEAADGDHTFEARLPAESLVAHQQTNPVEERAVWLARLVVHGKPQALAVPPGAPLAHVTTGSRRISAECSVHGNLLFHESYCHPLVDAMEWVDGTTLRLHGLQDRSPERPGTLIARRYVTPADRIDVPLSLAWDGGRFTAQVDVADLVARADAVRTGSEGHAPTPWEFLMEYAEGLDPAQADTAHADAMADPREVSGRQVRTSLGRSARLRLLVE